MGRQLDPSDPTVAAAVFGQKTREFLTSDVGDYLLTRSKDTETSAIERLIDGLGTLSEREINELRLEIRCARWFQQWLGEAIDEGDQALQILKEDA